MTHRALYGFLINKTARYGLIIFLVLTMNFAIPRLMPGDPVTNMLGEDVIRIDDNVLDALKAKYGLEEPVFEQYVDYLFSLWRLDLGFSINKNMPVTDLIAQRLFWTLLLVVPSIVAGSVIALAAGIYSGFRRGRAADTLLVSASTFLFTVPGFLVAMLSVSVFSFHLGLFPLGHVISGDSSGPAMAIDVVYHLFLPACVLTLLGANSKFLVIRNSVVQIMDEYFIFVARARGIPEKRIMFVHVLSNIMPQFISILALNVGFMVSGALLVEIVFSLNGMGTLIYDAILARDYPLIQGCFLVITLVVLVSNFAAELLYGIADPRVGDARTPAGDL